RTGERDPPAEAAAAGRDVLQSFSQESENFVAADLGLHELRFSGEQILEELLVAGEPEEPVPLLDQLERPGGMQRAVPVHDVRFGLERLTSDAVKPGVRLLVKIIRVAREDLLDQLAHSPRVRWGGGSEW